MHFRRPASPRSIESHHSDPSHVRERHARAQSQIDQSGSSGYLQGEQIESVRDLEIADLRRRILEVRLVMRQLKFERVVHSSRSDTNRPVHGCIQRTCGPVRIVAQRQAISRYRQIRRGAEGCTEEAFDGKPRLRRGLLRLEQTPCSHHKRDERPSSIPVRECSSPRRSS